MSKTCTVWKPTHPKNMAHTCGQRAKEAARKLSNIELDKLLSDNLQNPDELAEVLTWPRSKKLEFIKQCAMGKFITEWNEANKIEPVGAE